MFKLIIFVLLNIVSISLQQCPSIVSRSQWGAKPPTSKPETLGAVPYVIIHHSADPSTCTSNSACATKVKSIQNYHMTTNKWADVGYNFLIGGNGVIYEGRGWGKKGAHAGSDNGYNSVSVGIVFIGTYSKLLPSSTALTSAQALISCGVKNGYIKSTYSLIGHRQVQSTECPGDALFNQIKKWPRFNPLTQSAKKG